MEVRKKLPEYKGGLYWVFFSNDNEENPVFQCRLHENANIKPFFSIYKSMTIVLSTA